MNQNPKKKWGGTCSAKWQLTDQERQVLVAMAAGGRPEKKTYYTKALAQVEEGKVSWNWSAALLGELWLFYHRAFLFGWLFMGIKVCTGLIGTSPGPFLGTVFGGMGVSGNQILFRSLYKKMKQGYANLPQYKTTEEWWVWIFSFLQILDICALCVFREQNILTILLNLGMLILLIWKTILEPLREKSHLKK